MADDSAGGKAMKWIGETVLTLAIIGVVAYFFFDVNVVDYVMGRTVIACDKSEVTAEINKMFKEQLLPRAISSQMINQSQISLQEVSTVSLNKDAGRCECRGVAVISNSKLSEPVRINLLYSTQRTDRWKGDGQLYLELDGSEGELLRLLLTDNS